MARRKQMGPCRPVTSEPRSPGCSASSPNGCPANVYRLSLFTNLGSQRVQHVPFLGQPVRSSPGTRKRQPPAKLRLRVGFRRRTSGANGTEATVTSRYFWQNRNARRMPGISLLASQCDRILRNPHRDQGGVECLNTNGSSLPLPRMSSVRTICVPQTPDSGVP